MTVVRRNLGINMVNNFGPSSHIVKILVDSCYDENYPETRVEVTNILDLLRQPSRIS